MWPSFYSNTEEKRQAEIYGKGLISVDVLTELMRDIKMKRKILERELVKHQKEAKKQPERPNLTVQDIVKHTPLVLKELEKEEKQDVLRQLNTKVIVDNKRVNATIKGRIPLKLPKGSKKYELRSISRNCWVAECR